jgi:Nitrile hydratase, alpha chain
MSPPPGFDDLSGRVADFAPVFREPLDSPYEISNELYAALRHVLHDVGGQIDLPLPFKEKVEEEWEMNTYVTCECLGWRGAWNSEVRVHDSNQKSRFMVMPMRPEGTEGWTEDQLEAIVTRDTMIGVAVPQVDWTASGPPSAARVNA